MALLAAHFAPALALQENGSDLPTCEVLEDWKSEVQAALGDPAAVDLAAEPILDAWQEFLLVSRSPSGLDEEGRRDAACCGRLVADLAGVCTLPEGTSRLMALRQSCEWADRNPLVDRRFAAGMESDLIEELMFAGEHSEFFARIERARASYADVPEVLVEILLLGANLREVLGDFSGALEWADSAQGLLSELPASAQPSDYVDVFAWLVRAKIFTHIGVLDEATRSVDEARKIAEVRGTRRTLPIMLLTETELAQARGDRDWVLDHVPSALVEPIFDEFPDMRLALTLEVLQAEAQKALQLNQGMGQARESLLDMVENLGLEDSRAWAPALLVCDLDLAQGNVQAARALADRVGEAIEDSEEWTPLLVRIYRSGVLGRLCLIEPGAGDERLDESIATAEATLADLLVAWDSIPRRKGGVGFLHFDVRRSLLTTLASLYAERWGSEAGAERTLETLLAVEARGSLADEMGIDSADLRSAREHLIPPVGGLLVLIPSASGSVAISLDSNGAATWQLPSSDSWERASDRLALEMRPSQAMDPGSAERLRHHSKVVRDLVIPPELDIHISSWDSVMFVRAENMGWIPFEVLPLAGRGGRPLGQELATAYLPSLRLGLGLSVRAKHRETKEASSTGPERVLFAVGPTAPRGELERGPFESIPWSNHHERGVREPWLQESVRIELDPVRALESVLQAGRAGYELTVIISHGTRDSDREASQGFGFDVDTPVYPARLGSMLASPTTVLLVCGASASPIRRGDDLGSHLAAVFLARGTDVIASSRTDLSFEASLELFRVLQRELASGESPAHALRTARRHLVDSTLWSHPAYHSNLSLTGLGFASPSARLQSAAKGNNSIPSGFGAGVVALLLIVGVIVLTRRGRKAA